MQTSFQQIFISLILLLAWIIFGILLVSGATAALMFCLDIPFSAFDNVGDSSYEHINGLKLVQIVSQLGMFVVPAVGFAFTQSRSVGDFLGILPNNTTREWQKGLLLTAGVILFAFPFLAWVLQLNMQMQLPGAFADLEAWMRESEEQLTDLTEAFLKMDTIFDLLFNLTVVAIVPAFCEEILFRGALQPVLQKLVNNPHVGILLTAIIFSAIHLQFFGFFPRMIIGVYLGYLFYWSGNLWLPIFGHFINNGIQVLAVYFGAVDIAEAANAPEQEIPAYIAIISLVLLLSLIHI